MLAFFDFDWYHYLVEAIEKAFKINIPDQLEGIVFLFVLAGLIIIIPIMLTWKWRKEQLDEILKGNYKYTKWRNRRLYIKTWLQTTPPNDRLEPYKNQYETIRTEAFDIFIKQFLVRGNDDPPFYCILGGSGMGKSTFVIHLVRKYICRYYPKVRKCPYTIKLLYCGEYTDDNETLINRIEKIENPGNTILILDALDENNDAIDKYNSFLEGLLKSISKFRIVIITCRTQFFEKNEDELDKLPKRDEITHKIIRFNKYYISPFNDKEINRYLNKKYFLRLPSRIKAQKIANNCKLLMARPLLLSYMDDLLNSNIDGRKESIVQIYDILITKWLGREADYAEKEGKDYDEFINTLKSFSKDLALCMAQPSYEKKQIEEIIKRYNAQTLIKERNLKGRSLLNRNSSDEFKFAHKSIMEYLVAKQLVEKNGEISIESIDFISNDMIPKFYCYMVSEIMKLTISVSDNKLLFSRELSHFSNTFLSSRSSLHPVFNTTLFLSGKCLPQKERILSAFLSYFCINRVAIIIDCKYDYFKFVNCILDFIGDVKSIDEDRLKFTNNNGDTFTMPSLILINFDFSEDLVINMVKRINIPIVCYFAIVNNKNRKHISPKIAEQLIIESSLWKPKLFISVQEPPDNNKTYLLRNYLLMEHSVSPKEIRLINKILDLIKKIGEKGINAEVQYELFLHLTNGTKDYLERDYHRAQERFFVAYNFSNNRLGSRSWITREIHECIDMMLPRGRKRVQRNGVR